MLKASVVPFGTTSCMSFKRQAKVCDLQATNVHGLVWLGRVLDSLIYMFSPVIACFLLRLLQVSQHLEKPSSSSSFTGFCVHAYSISFAFTAQLEEQPL